MITDTVDCKITCFQVGPVISLIHCLTKTISNASTHPVCNQWFSSAQGMVVKIFLQCSVFPLFWILGKGLASSTMPRASVVPPQIVIERGTCARHWALAGVVNRQLCLQTISKPNSSRHRVTGTNEGYCYSEAKIRRSESKCPNFRGIEIWQRLQTIENSDGPSSSVVWG